MKKLSPEQRKRQILLQHMHERREAKKKNPKRLNRSVKISEYTIFPIPEFFSLYSDEEFEYSINFIEKIQKTLERKEKILLDFNNTKNITAAAMLRLQAEVSTWQRYYNRRLVKTRSGTAISTVKTILKDSGFLSEYDDPESTPRKEKILTMRTGTNARGHLNSITNTMNECFYSGELSEEEQSDLYRSISEAMLNVSQHAYNTDSDLENKIGKRWWIYAQQFTNQLYIAFFDRGVGIPETLPRHGQWENIRSLGKVIGLNDDAAMIQAAMKFGRSQARQAGRGLGLQDILKFATESPEGVLWIFSRRGLYKYEKNKENPTLVDYPKSIGGTLIQWQVSLSKRQT